MIISYNKLYHTIIDAGHAFLQGVLRNIIAQRAASSYL